jgi:hypothetical protein
MIDEVSENAMVLLQPATASPSALTQMPQTKTW